MVAARTHVSIFTRFFDLKSARGRGTDVNRGLFDLHRHSRGKEEEEGAKIGAKTLPRREKKPSVALHPPPTVIRPGGGRERGAGEEREDRSNRDWDWPAEETPPPPSTTHSPCWESSDSNSKGGVERRGAGRSPQPHSLNPTLFLPCPPSLPAGGQADWKTSQPGQALGRGEGDREREASGQEERRGGRQGARLAAC